MVRKVMTMETAKIFINGRSQAVRLPKDFRFSGDEVYAQKIGDAVMLFPKEQSWEIFLNGLNSFTPDFLSEGRNEEIPTKRNSL
jgi:antitoxin VapB